MYMLTYIYVLALGILILQEVCHQYWPDTGTTQIGEYIIDLLGEEQKEGFIIRMLGIRHEKVIYMYVDTSPRDKTIRSISCSWVRPSR